MLTIGQQQTTGGPVSETDIFLSYARHDQATARIIAGCLGDEGFSVWWDASLHSGETFDEVIEQRLRDAKAVVVLWSPRSVASRWVRAEATLADRRNKLAPAIIEACDRPIIFELTHAADLCDWGGDVSDVRWRSFVDDLRRLVARGAEQQPVAAPQPPQQAKSPPQPLARQPLRPGSEQVIVARQPPRSTEPPLARDLPERTEVHCLELDDADLGEDLFLIEASSAKLGRTAPADIVLAHKSVSREHCVVGLANDELFVTDLNSTNGTYVDDVRVARTTVVPIGSVVRVGQVSLRHSVRSGGDADERLAAIASGGSPQPPRLAAAR
jgi:hypothetical protein